MTVLEDRNALHISSMAVDKGSRILSLHHACKTIPLSPLVTTQCADSLHDCMSDQRVGSRKLEGPAQDPGFLSASSFSL